MKELILRRPVGRARPSLIIQGHEVCIGRWCKNAVLLDWTTIVGTLLTQGKVNYRLSMMYIEFQNLSDPDDPADIPAFNADDPAAGIDYFNGLIDSADRDYLRVPLIAATLSSTDETRFPSPKGNLMTFFAQTQGVVGTHGKSFSDVDNSKVVGGALISAPDSGDATQDLAYNRFYFDVGDQQVKLPTSQVGVTVEAEIPIGV